MSALRPDAILGNMAKRSGLSDVAGQKRTQSRDAEKIAKRFSRNRRGHCESSNARHNRGYSAISERLAMHRRISKVAFCFIVLTVVFYVLSWTTACWFAAGLAAVFEALTFVFPTWFESESRD
jgi:hypothetical protein